MPCGATQDGQVMVERSDGMWSTGEGNGKALQYSCPPANAGDERDVGLTPGSGRFPEIENGNPFQYLARKIPSTDEPGGL